MLPTDLTDEQREAWRLFFLRTMCEHGAVWGREVEVACGHKTNEQWLLDAQKDWDETFKRKVEVFGFSQNMAMIAAGPRPT